MREHNIFVSTRIRSSPLPGFLVIASRRHIQSIADMQEAEYRDFCGLLRRAPAAIKMATGVEVLTIVQEESSIHFHLWFFPWTKSVIESYGKPSLSSIREIMSDSRKRSVLDDEWMAMKASIENIKACWDNS